MQVTARPIAARQSAPAVLSLDNRPADRSTPAKTFAEVDRAAAARDVDALLACMELGLREAVRQIIDDARQHGYLDAFFAEIEHFSSAVGDLLEDGPTRKVYAYHRDGGQSDTQVVELAGNEWLLAN